MKLTTRGFRPSRSDCSTCSLRETTWNRSWLSPPSNATATSGRSSAPKTRWRLPWHKSRRPRALRERRGRPCFGDLYTCPLFELPPVFSSVRDHALDIEGLVLPILHHQGSVDEDVSNIARAAGVDEPRENVATRLDVRAVETDDHHVRSLAHLDGAGHVVEPQRPRPVDRRQSKRPSRGEGRHSGPHLGEKGRVT